MDLDEFPSGCVAHEHCCPPHLDWRVPWLRELWNSEDPTHRTFAKRLHLQQVDGDITDVTVTAQEVGNGGLTRQDFVLIGPHEPEPAWVPEMLRDPSSHAAGGGCIEVLASDEHQVIGRFHARTIAAGLRRHDGPRRRAIDRLPPALASIVDLIAGVGLKHVGGLPSKSPHDFVATALQPLGHDSVPDGPDMGWMRARLVPR